MDNLEWIETTGNGGYACGTTDGSHTRRYHGLFTAATAPDERRKLLLSRLDETVYLKDQKHELSVREFLSGEVVPDGKHYLVHCKKEIGTEFFYRIQQDSGQDIEITKTIYGCAAHGSIVIIYNLIKANSAQQPIELALEPFMAFRNFHELRRRSEDRIPNIEPTNHGLTFVRGDTTLFVNVEGQIFEFESDPHWYEDFYYSMEKERGYDYVEDLYRPGLLKTVLKCGAPLLIQLSSKQPLKEHPPSVVLQAEKRRRTSLAEKAMPKDRLAIKLHLAADQFLVADPRGEQAGEQIVAGYPWFTVWGRDTMISLPGLTLVPKRFTAARDILRSWSAAITGGLIPNRLHTREGGPDFNTVDAPLWFIHAAYRYHCYTKDERFVTKTLLPAVLNCIENYTTGTRYNIKEGADGLISAGDENSQLTWMDAKYDGVPVTPRNGKAVEINALWINALAVAACFAELDNQSELAQALLERKERSQTSFNEQFWYEEGEYLYDVVSEQGRDASLRPNQLFALALPVHILDADKAQAILDRVSEELLTPYGLRTLAPRHADYKGTYVGTLAYRDSAYHQGTVWPWLLGGYLTALIRYGHKSLLENRDSAQKILSPLLDELDSRAALGTLSEIYDGDSPHTPRGAFAQAWSVAEPLRAYVEDVIGIKPPCPISESSTSGKKI